MMNAQFINSISKISKNNWQALNTSYCPFLHYDFFQAIENSHSACIDKGWEPHHLLLHSNNELKAILPLYLKQHSWGEYVFDWDWAEAFQRNGYFYYPKLVSTYPFTPVPSNKLLSEDVHIKECFFHLTEYCQQQSIHSWHLLFYPEVAELPEDVYHRNTVQFHWFNRGYANFDDFLATFTSRKRKNTRKERASIAQQGIEIRQIIGTEITQKELDFFYLTYQLTYLKRGHTPHLTKAFFQQIIASMPDKILLIIASAQQSYSTNDTKSNATKHVAAALFFFDQHQLYGRYWGCSEHFDNLHFELCYYQGIEFCIKHKLEKFNPGTQGEHKIQRGFEPVLTHSYHWIKEPAFRPAIKDFCQQERLQMQHYQSQCTQALPFKKNE